MEALRIAVTGSTGLIGTALVQELRARGHRVVRLVRQAPAGEDEIAWDPLAPAGGLRPGALDGVDAVVHVAGANVAGRRWSPAGSGFLPGVVEQWEAAAGQAAEAGVRVVTMRAGVVVSRHGGILARLLP